jgi:hypothetical protein
MTVLSFNINEPGQAGVFPSMIRIETNDTLATVMTAGYLNDMHAENVPIASGMMALVSTKTSPNSAYSTSSWLDIQYSNGDWSLVSIGVAPGSITLPTIANHLAVFTDTAGSLGEDVSTAINGGNIQAGLSGTAGALISYPASATTGSLKLSAVANSGNFVVDISNAAHGQATTYSIADVGNAAGRLLNAATNTPFTSGHLLEASGTGGIVSDAGIAASAVQLNTNIKAATTANIGGSGAGPLTVTVAGMTASSVVVASIATSSNAAAVEKCVAGSGSFNVTFTADPGATCTLNYVAFLAAQ